MKTFPGARLALFLLSMPAFSAFAEDSVMKSATYCHALEDNQSPKDPAEFFYPDQTVFLSMELIGRPTAGIATAKFFFREDVIAEAKVDVATANKGILFSFGQNTFIGFNLKPTGPLPVGALYHTELTFDGKPLGSFPFRVDPPKGSIPSNVASTVLAKGVDDKSAPVGETHSFTSVEKVVLAGRGDLGNRSWLEASWYVAGKLDDEGTKSVTLEEDKKDVPFFFSYIPKGGWPAGDHAVALLLNGKEVARQTFTIIAAPLDAVKKITIKRSVLLQDDGKGGEGAEAKSFQTSDLVLHVKFFLDAPALVKGTRVAWTLVKSAEVKPQEIAVVTIEDDGLLGVISGNLSTKKGLPTGDYRVDLLQGENVIATKDFSVGAP